MSRPTPPAWTPFSWATNANYPPGSDDWSNQPTKVAHPGPAGGFVPGQGAGAEYFNYLFNVLGQRGADEHAYFNTLLSFVGQAQLLNFGQGLAASFDIRHNVKFNAATRTWYAAGLGFSEFVRTLDPYSWPTTTEITDPLAVADYALWDYAVDPSGNVVGFPHAPEVDDDSFVFRYDAGTLAWSSSASNPTFGSSGVLYPSVVYDDTADLWCAAANTTAGAIQVLTSVDGITWTTRTPPTGLPADGTVTMAYAAGVIVMSVVSDADRTKMWMSRSTNGGVAWSAATEIALGFSQCFKPTTVSDPASNGLRQPVPVWTGAKWLAVATCCASGGGLTRQSKVYESANGSSWSAIRTFSTIGVRAIQCIGDLVLTFDAFGTSMIFSPDAGVTWLYGNRPMGAVLSIAASPLQFLVATNVGGGGQVFIGHAAGTGLGSVP